MSSEDAARMREMRSSFLPVTGRDFAVRMSLSLGTVRALLWAQAAKDYVSIVSRVAERERQRFPERATGSLPIKLLD